MKIGYELEGANEFRTYLLTVKGRFFRMLRTMLDVKDLIHANTNVKVPLDTGRLEESYYYRTLTYNREMIEVEIGYNVVDPKSGFHYAEYQHDKIETWQHYNKSNRRGEMRGEQFYLSNGIRASESMAYELIESDYLSLFGGIRVNE